MTPARALALWRAVRDRPVLEEEAAVSAGRRGEDAIDRVLGGPGGRLWSGRRVPRTTGGGRLEIDQILLTPRAIYVVETKAWSGRLTVEGEGIDGRFLQTRRQGRGVVDHGDVWGKLKDKAHALTAFLHARGARVAPAAVRPVLIFWNPDLAVPRWLEARPEVVTRREFEDAGLQAGSADDLLGLLLRREGETVELPEMTGGLRRRLRKALDRLGCYDRLVLHGGRTLVGDFRAIRRADGRVLADAARLRRAPHLRYYPGLHGLVRACLGAPPAVVVLDRRSRRLWPDDRVLFHPAGQPRMIEMDAWAVDRIEKG